MPAFSCTLFDLQICFFTSYLSLFTGQISTQRAALRVREFRSKYSDSVAGFLEEMIIRRELADNFCFYKLDEYDSVEGGYEWAQKTLEDHRNDKREKVYTRDQLENSKTHDQLWNASQVSFRLIVLLLGNFHTTIVFLASCFG